MRLTKVKIINWMYIDNTTIDINNNAVLIGQNGSGKTTIIDAIQYALTGSKADSKFNSAQGSSKRNLESYVRGTIGSKEKEHLRPNDTISYVLIQLEDKKDIHVFGVALEYTNRLSENRFYLNNKSIEEHYFLDGKENYKDYKTFREQFEKDEIEIFHSRGQYQNKIRDVMGLLSSSNYFRLIGKALQLKSLDNINSFISEFLLEIDELDISSLQDVISSIKRVRMSIEQNKERYDLLSNINELSDKVIELVNKVGRLKNEVIVASETLVKREIEENENKLKTARINKDELEAIGDDLINNKNQINKQIRNIDKEIETSFPDLSKYKNEINEKEELLKSNYEKEKSLNKDFKEDKLLINSKDLSHEQDLKIKKLFNELYNDRTKYNGDILSNKIDNLKNMILKRQTELSYQKEIYNKERRIQQDLLNEYKNRLKQLKSGIQTYPKRTRQLIDLIKIDLKEYYQEDIEVNVLSKYLDITNDQYRDAIEGYLDRNRLNILVEPKYYKDALKTYYRHYNQIYGVNLIDTTKVKPSRVVEGTLSEFIISDNKHALNYVNSLLNRVHYVSDINELNKHRSSITKDCMLYSKYLVRKINPKIYKTQYIGQEALKRNIEQQEDLIKDQTKKLNETINIINNLSKIDELYSKLNIENKNPSDFKVYSKIINLEQQLKELKSIMDTLNKDDKFLRLSEKADKYKQAFNNNEKLIEKNNLKYSETINIIIELRKSIDEKSHQLIELQAEVSKIDVILLSELKESFVNVKVTNRYIENINKEIHKHEVMMDSQKNYLENMMKNYIHKFNEKFTPSLEDVSKYKKAYKDINKTQFELNAELTAFQVKLSDIITKDFISKINTNITKIKNTINDINQKLKQSVFGIDNTYKITFKPSEDTKFKTLYEIAVRNDVKNPNMFNPEQVEEDLRDIELILDQYNNEKLNLDIHEILDVRKYFRFDVVVKSKDQTKHLSEVIQTQSGGEIQTPFYILITAAFEQTKDYRRKNDSFNLVLFDEAFSNMDPQRISEMLKYYEKFNIQTIISVPSKLESLGSYVNTALGVYRKGEVTHVIQFEKDFAD